jgi:hypothetical protein
MRGRACSTPSGRSIGTRARVCLALGRSVGIFPEGTVNRDPHRLLAGRRSAALLSLERRVPVVPEPKPRRRRMMRAPFAALAQELLHESLCGCGQYQFDLR